MREDDYLEQRYKFDRFKRALDAWASDATPPGGFLMAVLRNDLAEAVARADDEALQQLRRIVDYVWHELPGPCHGSRAVCEGWIRTHSEPSGFVESARVPAWV